MTSGDGAITSEITSLDERDQTELRTLKLIEFNKELTQAAKLSMATGIVGGDVPSLWLFPRLAIFRLFEALCSFLSTSNRSFKSAWTVTRRKTSVMAFGNFFLQLIGDGIWDFLLTSEAFINELNIYRWWHLETNSDRTSILMSVSLLSFVAP